MGINLFNSSEATAEREIKTTVAKFGNVRIEKIVSYGQESGWYCQEENEWVCVLDGEAELTYEDGSTEKLFKGDSVFIPKQKKHKVSKTSKPCIWLCVFAGGLG